MGMAAKIAIVGRPNVGKSTLFNRLAGKRLALVHDMPGVTRDRREATGRLGDLDLVLIDTAGFEEADAASLEGRMRAQTMAAIADADVALFLIDARVGVTPLDESFAQLLRESGKRVVLAANKAEGPAAEANAMEAYRLGHGAPVPLSAMEGDGLSDLRDALAEALAQAGLLQEDEESEEEEADDEGAPIRLAVVGRPNAGKSTLLNALLGEERLLTGPEAGITRDAVPVSWEWEGRRVRLHDTAGMRKKAKISDALEKMSVSDTIRAIKFAEVVILVLDAENPFDKQDLAIADLAIREGRGLVFAVTKWDLIPNKTEQKKHIDALAERLLPQVKGAPVLYVSGKTGKGLDRLMPAIEKLRRDWSAKVKTRDLNDWMQEAVSRHPPPAVAGARIKPRYLSQTKARPPTFVLMANRADMMPDSYKRYLVNGIREAFNLWGTPVRFIVRSGKNPYVEGE